MYWSNMTWGLLHKTFTGEKLRLFQPEFFFSYGKVNGKNHAILSFQILPELLFSGKSFMQWAPG